MEERRRGGGGGGRDTARAYNPVIFFSLSLSIFATVGIVIFVRNCVRCPPIAEVMEGNRGGVGERGPDTRIGELGIRGGLSKSPTPIPVLYSLVSEEEEEGQGSTVSPSLSQMAFHDGTETTVLDSPSGGTPMYTPESNTPDVSPSYGGVRSSLTPAAFPTDPVSFAVTHAADDVITIATNSCCVYAKYLPNYHEVIDELGAGLGLSGVSGHGPAVTTTTTTATATTTTSCTTNF